MKREKMQELYHEILDKIIIYLYQIKDKFNEQSEIDYYSFIEQDLEKLLHIKNYSIIEISIFDKVRKCYMVIIKYLEDVEFKNKDNNYKIIIESLYHNFKYIMESILFMIENIFLDA